MLLFAMIKEQIEYVALV